MSGIPGDLVLLAGIARTYGFTDSAQDLYLLAQLSAHAHTPLGAADMLTGLSLMGLLAAHIDAGTDEVPELVQGSLPQGHAVLARYTGTRLHDVSRWCALCHAERFSWRGLAVGSDFATHSIGSALGQLLTGSYLIVARVLPGWEPDSAEILPHVN